MPVPARRLESGTIWVGVPAAGEAGCTVVYVRVSALDQRSDLDRQFARLSGRASSNGHVIGEVVTEVGSGLNGRRPKLWRALSDPSASVVLVEHRDRLARFGGEYLEAALSAQGRRVLVTDRGGTVDDDMVEVLTAVCARLDGRGGARNAAMPAVTATKRAEAVVDG